MNVELKILEYLVNNDNGSFVNVSLIDENYHLITRVIDNLLGRNLIIAENRNPRDFGAFGITNKVDSINVKINSNGREYLYCLTSTKSDCSKSSKKRIWEMAYFFG